MAPRAARLGFALALWAATHGASAAQDPYDAVNASWDRLGSVYGRIVESYYDSVDQSAIMQAAIEGMLEQLDPYSHFYDEEGLRQLRQDTTGRFAGLGITVGIKDLYPVVLAPIEGTPADRAGLVPGDLVVSIDGDDTRGLSLDEIVERLRGEPGTHVRIRVAHRAGATQTRQVAIVREMISIRSVALAEQVRPGIGYIGMQQTRFSEQTSREVEEALQQLQASGAHSLILDLRGNPGGLLSQATAVADLFLPKGAPIVSVRERGRHQAEVETSRRRPASADLPLVVLIDGGSASAAEIVAGAIQDNDRGVIVGTTSFGKGSVQTIFDLRQEHQSALKLTTALYYTPSGRSIHRDAPDGAGLSSRRVSVGERRIPSAALLEALMRAPDQVRASAALRSRFGLSDEELEELWAMPLDDVAGYAEEPAARDSAASLPGATTFRTRRGREVLGGGGIAPDVAVPADRAPLFVQELRDRRIFFNFVIDYVGEDTTRLAALHDGPPQDQMLTAFEEYLVGQGLAAELTRTARQALERVQRLAEGMGWAASLEQPLAELAATIQQEASRGVSEAARPRIKHGLMRELALRAGGRREQLRLDLAHDAQVAKAVEILEDGPRYALLLGEAGD